MGGLLTASPSAAAAADAARLGALMYESHASYSACGLGSDGTDRLVSLARAAGSARGIHGAKITGGGSGGTVAILADASAGETVRAIAREYADETGRDAYVFEGTSPGAARIGAIRLDPLDLMSRRLRAAPTPIGSGVYLPTSVLTR